MSGVTTTRSTGESKGADYALRRAIDRGEAIGPRMFTAGETLNVTGGHGWNPSEEGLDTADAFRRAVRRRALRRRRVDQDRHLWRHRRHARRHRRVAHDQGGGGGGHRHRAPARPEGHGAFRLPAATLEAIEAGLDCVEHGYFLTDEVLERMVEKGVWLVPTIVVAQRTVMEFFKKIGSPDWYLARVTSVGESHFKMLQQRDQAQGEDRARHRPVPVRAERRDDRDDPRGPGTTSRPA